VTLTDEALLARARRHAALRWAGIGTSLFAIAALGATVWAAATGAGPWKLVAVAVFTCGLSLGSFGANNDTSLHALRSLADSGAGLPRDMAEELAHERRVRPARLAALHSTPTVGLVLPVVADLLVLFLAWRAAIALGLLGGTP
jgi:hypothetical protein